MKERERATRRLGGRVLEGVLGEDWGETAV